MAAELLNSSGVSDLWVLRFSGEPLRELETAVWASGHGSVTGARLLPPEPRASCVGFWAQVGETAGAGGELDGKGREALGGFSFNRKHAGKEQGLEPGALEGQRWESQERASPGPQGWASTELRGGGAGRTGAESEGVPALRAWLILPSPCRAFTRSLAPMRVSCM